MGISGIGSRLSNQYAFASLTNKKNNDIAANPTTNKPKFVLHSGPDGELPLTATASRNGTSVSVFRPKDGSTICPVSYWDENGTKYDTSVDVSKVDPRNASYIEMLAYSGYTDSMGYTTDAQMLFGLASMGVNNELSYDTTNLNTKTNFQALVENSMDQMYKTSFMESYLLFKKYYDFLSSK